MGYISFISMTLIFCSGILEKNLYLNLQIKNTYLCASAYSASTNQMSSTIQ